MAIAMRPIGQNDYRFSVQDEIWIESHIHLSQIDFLKGLVERKFDDGSIPLSSNFSLVVTAQRFITENPYPFDQNDYDRNWRNAFLRLPVENSDEVISEFQFLLRGYKDVDAQQLLHSVTDDLTRFRDLIDNRIVATEQAISQAESINRTKRVERLHFNLYELKGVRESINKLHRFPHIAAHRKALAIALVRRFGTKTAFFSEKDYLGVESKIRRFDPKLVDFPLRFLGFLPNSEYQRLFRLWGNGASRSELLRDLVSDNSDLLEEESFNEAYTKIALASHKSRSGQLNELYTCWTNSCPLSTCLVAMTIVEGILWDFSAYLNSRDMPIFRTEENGHIYYYLWERKKQRYKTIPNSSDLVVKRASHRTARELLEHTRLSGLLYRELFYYLYDDFYLDRNNISHGNLADRNIEEDAIASVLCLYALIDNIASIIHDLDDKSFTEI